MTDLKFPKPIKTTKTSKPLKRTSLNKVGKTPIDKLEKQLDTIVSKLVIARDKKCVQCGSTEKLTCGHLFSRRHKSTRWDLINCNCQCWPCNFGHGLDTSKYTRWFLDHYGVDIWNALEDRYRTIRKWTRGDLECMYRDFEHQLNSLLTKV